MVVGWSDGALHYRPMSESGDLPSLTEFVKTVDGCHSTIALHKGSLEALYDYLGLPHDGNYSSLFVEGELGKRLSGCFSSGLNVAWHHCRSLINDLVFESVVHDAALDPYLAVLELLRDHLRPEQPQAEPCHGDWFSAVQIAFDLEIISYSDRSAVRQILYQRQFEVARSSKRLQCLGVRAKMRTGKVELEFDESSKIVDEIEDLISSAGGSNIAQQIFSRLEPIYDNEQERYHLVRESAQPGKASLKIPFSYLLLLCLKQVTPKPYTWRVPLIFKRLCEVATDYAATFDVQIFGRDYRLRIDPLLLMSHLQEEALHDMLFYLPQIRGSDVTKLLRGLLDGLNLDEDHGDWSLNELIAVIEWLLHRATPIRGSFIFNKHAVSSAFSSLPEKRLDRVMMLLTHAPYSINQKFKFPTDTSVPHRPDIPDKGPTFFVKPLLQLETDAFCLIDRSMCSTAFVEAALTPLRLIHNHLDDAQLGPALERFVVAEMQAHGIDVSRGTYSASGEPGQCDAVIETADHIIFLEVKKKALTRASRAGGQAFLLLDLTQSVVEAQVQAGWHELRMRKLGYIELNNQSATQKIEIKGRSIERVALSLYDFGCFQDRMFLTRFLEAAVVSKFRTDEPSLFRKCERLNKLLDELRSQTQQLSQLNDAPRRAFFHCWFLSVPQLLVLLDGVYGAEQFKAALWMNRHIITGSCDFYYDLKMIKQMLLRGQADRDQSA